MPQNKHNNAGTKKGTTKVPRGSVNKRPTTRKRQAQNVSSSDEVEVPSLTRKRQKQKEPTEIIGSSDEDPEVSHTDGFRSYYGSVEQSVEVSATSIIRKFSVPIDGPWQRDSNTDEQHHARIGEQLATKGDTTKDLDLMFLKPGKVKFGVDEILKGRWCITCK
jgi:hypothetical protein